MDYFRKACCGDTCRIMERKFQDVYGADLDLPTNSERLLEGVDSLERSEKSKNVSGSGVNSGGTRRRQL
jgi:hypothetical protein